MSSSRSKLSLSTNKKSKKPPASLSLNQIFKDPKSNFIQPKLHWTFDNSRKDSKKQARLRGIKYFYALEIKLCNNDFRYFKCLKSDKPCCKHFTLNLEKSELKINQFPERRHHIKQCKLEIGSKFHLRLQSKFWFHIAPKITALDYVSNDIANFKQLIMKSRASNYRALKNVSFPIIRQFDNDFYSRVFKFLKALPSLKILSYNIVKTLTKEATLPVLKDLQHLQHLKALDINIKSHDPLYFKTLSEILTDFKDLRFLCLKFGKKVSKEAQQALLNQAINITTHLTSISHLDLEINLSPLYQTLFEKFLGSLENMKNLISLNLTIDRHQSSFTDPLSLPNPSNSIFTKIKYFNLEATNLGMGFDLAKYFLNNLKDLRVCNLKNVELGKKSLKGGGNEDFSQYLLQNKELKELKLAYQKKFNQKSLENLLENLKNLNKLQLFSIQLSNQDTLSLNFECLVDMIKDLQNADTIIIEILFPIQIKANILNRLFDNFMKLRGLSAIKVDLRLSEEIKGSNIKKLFQHKSLDILTIFIEGMKLGKEDQTYIKETTKKLKKLNSCLIECENFKFDQKF